MEELLKDIKFIMTIKKIIDYLNILRIGLLLFSVGFMVFKVVRYSKKTKAIEK